MESLLIEYLYAAIVIVIIIFYIDTLIQAILHHKKKRTIIFIIIFLIWCCLFSVDYYRVSKQNPPVFAIYCWFTEDNNHSGYYYGFGYKVIHFNTLYVQYYAMCPLLKSKSNRWSEVKDEAIEYTLLNQ